MQGSETNAVMMLLVDAESGKGLFLKFLLDKLLYKFFMNSFFRL